MIMQLEESVQHAVMGAMQEVLKHGIVEGKMLKKIYLWGK